MCIRDSHTNIVSGCQYTGSNPILLTIGMYSRGSTSTYWCGFNQGKKLKIFPKKGSKAVYILRPNMVTVENKNENTGEMEKITLPFFKPAAVFNVQDMEGDKLEELLKNRRGEITQRPEIQRIDNAEKVLSKWPVKVNYGGDRACYFEDADKICLPDKDSFHNSSSYYATWAHECIHSTGHRDRLCRDLSSGCNKAYAREELIAELGSALLGDRLEIGSDVENHAAYLDCWIKYLKENPRVLFKILTQARKAADMIYPESQSQFKN